MIIGHKEDAHCASFESFAYLNLGYETLRELGPGEIVFITPEGVQTLSEPLNEMKICSFLWVYYGYPTSTYEGINVETMRYDCGKQLAKRDAMRDDVNPDLVAGIPDSGIPHAIGYANASGIPFARPFIKYTPTWPRSFMPTRQEQRNLIAKMKLIPVEALINANASGIPFARPFIKYTPTWPRSFMPTRQEQRNLIAKMKLIPVEALIKNRSLLLIDDSIVRGTQLRETTEFLYKTAACCSLMTLLSAEHSFGKPQNSYTTAEQKKYTSVRHARL